MMTFQGATGESTGLRRAALACLLLGTLACGGLSALLPEPRVTFLNPSDASVRFTAAGRAFEVEPGGILEVGLPYDGVWDVSVDGAVIGRVDLTRGPHWRSLKAFDLTATGCWVLVDGSAAYFDDHLGIRNPPPPPHVARTWRGVHQVEHGVGGSNAASWTSPGGKTASSGPRSRSSRRWGSTSTPDEGVAETS